MRLNSPLDKAPAVESSFKRNSRKIAALAVALGRKPTWQEILAEIAYDKEDGDDSQGMV
jgi:hypothetical protein